MEFLIIVGMIVYLIHLNRKIDTLRDQIHELRNKDVINQAHQTLTSKIEITDTPNISAEVKTLDTQNDATNQTIINTEINSESLNQLWSWLARDWPM